MLAFIYILLRLTQNANLTRLSVTSGLLAEDKILEDIALNSFTLNFKLALHSL
jgi:hypothetical protein